MDVAGIPQLVRNAGRFREVAGVLAKYGLAGWLGGVRVDWVQQFFSSSEGTELGNAPVEVRIRLALAELGTTYIKLGQILSTRSDLIGSELATELSHLQSGTPADPPEVVRELLRAELGEPAEGLYLEFEDEAMASASIAQVHRARTRDGRDVVVKIQHRGIEEKIRNDLDILAHLARLAERFAPQLRQVQPVETVAEFSVTLLRELDFGREARNLRQFAHNFRDDTSIRFPTVVPELSARRVLTMDYMRGIGISDAVALNAEGYDLSDLARRGANMFVEMIFRDGFYHADPHPGNLMVLPGDVIGVLDCGMVGRLDDDLREQFEDMLLAATGQDAARLTDSVVRLGRVPGDFDRETLQAEIDEFVVDFGGQSVEEFDLSGALNGIVRIIRKHGIILPARVTMLLKVLVMLEGTSRELSPDFSLAALLGPYRDQAIRRRLSPMRMWRKMNSAYRDWSRLLEVLPGDLSDILGRVKRGSFDVHLEHRRLECSVNRLVLGIVTAALFVGSATLWSREVPPVFHGYSIPGALGCGVAVLIGGRLLRAISRSGSID